MSTDRATPEPTTASDRFVGRVLGGKYRVDAFVGAGSMGRVYRATQQPLGRTVAVKVLGGTATLDATAPQRFLREAQAASRIEHPSSVAVFDFGREPDGTAFIVMEYLRGETLDDLLDREGRQPAARCVEVMSKVLAALSEAHRHGVVHRDLKPENIMLLRAPGDDRDAPTVKVTDFGIAKVLDDPAWRSTRLTATGVTPGSPAYMSPEQAAAREVDGRSDLYQCGVILYEMITDDVPFHGESAVGVMMHQIHSPTPSPRARNPRCPAALERVIRTAMEKDPARRFATATAMRQALLAVPLDEAEAEPGVHERPTMVPPPMEGAGPPLHLDSTPATELSLEPPAPSSGLRWVGLVAAVVAAALGTATFERPPRPQPATVHAASQHAAVVAAPPVVAPVAPVVFEPPRAAPLALRPVVRERPAPVRPAPRPRVVAPPYRVVAPEPAAPPVAESAPPAATEPATPPAPTPEPSPTAPEPAPAPPALVGVDGTLASLHLTGGVTRASVRERAQEAAESLGRCMFLAAGMLGDEAALSGPTTVHAVVTVRDRRADEVHLSGRRAAACREAVLGAFRGELPQGEDLEYEVRMSILLEPRR